MSAVQELSKLLATTLKVEEMRRLCRELPNGQELALALPEGATNREHYASELVDLLIRRKFVDSEVFERWSERVPGQREAIEVVARAWGITLPPRIETSRGVPGARRADGVLLRACERGNRRVAPRAAR